MTVRLCLNATRAAQVLFSSSSAALSFGFAHLLNAQFALVFGLCCMGASLLGVLIVSRIVERSGRVHSHLSPLPVFNSSPPALLCCALLPLHCTAPCMEFARAVQTAALTRAKSWCRCYDAGELCNQPCPLLLQSTSDGRVEATMKMYLYFLLEVF